MPPDRQDPLRQLAIDLAGKSTLLYILGHLLDLITTYLFTPDLTHEANPVIAVLGFGWSYILVSAAVTSAIMLAAQLWLWRSLLQRLPAERRSYSDFYHALFHGNVGKGRNDGKELLKGILIGILSITTYAVIAAKLLVGLWNLLILLIGLQVDDFVTAMLIKNGLAACFGLAQFFIYPYYLHRRLLAG